MSNVARNHKDNVFCLLYREKKNLLSLYNAMNGTLYKNEEELELRVTVININPGYSRELLEKCESLRGYMAFVEKVRSRKASGIRLEEAVRQAVDECVSEGILAEFFREHRKEIIEMGVYEFDQELYDRVLLEDGENIGMEKGKKIGREEATLEAIKNLMDALNMTREQAMAILKVPEEEQTKYNVD